jgi:hypothetical protein
MPFIRFLLNPAERTASTAKLMVVLGLMLAAEAIWRESMLRTLISTGIVLGGTGLLAFARRSS